MNYKFKTKYRFLSNYDIEHHYFLILIKNIIN